MKEIYEQEVRLIGLNGRVCDNFLREIRQKQATGVMHGHIFSGSEFEILSEYAGRLCYMSQYPKYSKKARDTAAYFQHILEVKHHSILGHNVFTVQLSREDYERFCVQFAGIPGWYPSKGYNLITVNYRFLENHQSKENDFLSDLLAIASKQSGNIFKSQKQSGLTSIQEVKDFEKLDDIGNQTWYSFEIKTSRRVCQELTRHSFEAAISQESTRYVDVSKRSFFIHPLYSKYFIGENRADFTAEYQLLGQEFQKNYLKKFDQLNQKLLTEGKPKGYSKKQARAYAADWMPLGLETNLIYSLSKRQLRDALIPQRINESADQQIHDLVILMKEAVVGL